MELTARKSPTGDAFPGLIVSRSRTPIVRPIFWPWKTFPAVLMRALTEIFTLMMSSLTQERASDGNGPVGLGFAAVLFTLVREQFTTFMARQRTLTRSHTTWAPQVFPRRGPTFPGKTGISALPLSS